MLQCRRDSLQVTSSVSITLDHNFGVEFAYVALLMSFISIHSSGCRSQWAQFVVSSSPGFDVIHF